MVNGLKGFTIQDLVTKEKLKLVWLLYYSQRLHSHRSLCLTKHTIFRCTIKNTLGQDYA